MASRRACLLAAGALCMLPAAVLALGRRARIGILLTGTASEPNYTVFIDALRELGYAEGGNLLLEPRWADGHPERLPALAAELARTPLDLIYAAGTSPAVAAQQALRDAQRNTPVVFVNVADPVGSGLVASFARPGGNCTGTAVISQELSGKRLEMLLKAAPRVTRLAAIGSGEPNGLAQLDALKQSAAALGLEVHYVEVRQHEDFATRKAEVQRLRADALYVLETPSNFYRRRALAELAASLRLPAIYGTHSYARAGGLMSYGSNYEANYRRAAVFVDKILKGALPADLPVEQPMRLDLVINRRAAAALGLALSPELLLRADEVIE